MPYVPQNIKWEVDAPKQGAENGTAVTKADHACETNEQHREVRDIPRSLQARGQVKVEGRGNKVKRKNLPNQQSHLFSGSVLVFFAYSTKFNRFRKMPKELNLGE